MTDEPQPDIADRINRRKNHTGAADLSSVAVITRDGTFRCAECRDELPDSWEGPNHWGIRFAEDPRVPVEHRVLMWDMRNGKSRCFLDDVDVTGDLLEFVVGDPGWVAKYARNRDGKRFYCANPGGLDEHPLYTIERGRVDVRQKVA